ncbi:MAG: ABC transporter substrate-binding protein [Xanthobacteraceae bacterium]|jgi:NitT/TauT family transport system substrate-binding protein
MKAVSVLLCIATLTFVTPAAAEDTLKIAVPQRGAWDTSISEIGQKAGIFKKYGLNLDLLFTGAGAEVMGAIIGGSVDLSVASGISTVIGGYGKGAPLRIFSSEMAGQPEIYWFVPANSPIKTLADMNGKTIGYSATGSSSHAALLALLAQEKVSAVPTALGGVTLSITAGMSGQVDAAWSAMPYGLKDLEEGKIRIIAKAADIKVLQGRTVRVNFTSASTLATKKDQFERYMAAYKETIDYMYSSPEALATYAEIAGVSLSIAQKIPILVTKESANPDQIVGMDSIIAEAIANKFLSAPLTKDQVAELVQMKNPPKP